MDLLEERYQKGSVIVTSQVDPKGWKKLFEDPVIGDAIVDRLTKPSKTVAFSGPSYRNKLKPKSNYTLKEKQYQIADIITASKRPEPWG